MVEGQTYSKELMGKPYGGSLKISITLADMCCKHEQSKTSRTEKKVEITRLKSQKVVCSGATFYNVLFSSDGSSSSFRSNFTSFQKKKFLEFSSTEARKAL